ncbi:hypothetical protein [Nocardia heshunensis]
MIEDDLLGRIDRLLAAAHSDWRRPLVVDRADGSEASRRYQLIESTRLQLGVTLTERPEWTAARSEEIFAVLLLDDGMTSQLVHPLIAAIGRRAVLQRLIATLEDERQNLQVLENAAQAAYWVRCWEPAELRRLRRAAVAAGARTASEVQSYLRAHREPELATTPVGDLWPRFWRACMRIFVACEDLDTRRRIQTAFPLESSCYPVEFAAYVSAATEIANADTANFRRLLEGSTGLGHSI